MCISLNLAICGMYYAIWAYILPHVGKYHIRQELIVVVDETTKVHRLVKVALAKLEAWGGRSRSESIGDQ